MARSSKQDVLDKFRFTVEVIQLDFSITGAVEGLAAGFNNAISQNLGTNPFVVLSRSGFSEVVLPKADINIISYRENVDAQRFSKGPGLVKYEPVTLRRGVALKASPLLNNPQGKEEALKSLTTGVNQDLYQWYQMVNNDNLLLATSNELQGRQDSVPSYDDNFRREVIISIKDRDGESIKQWILFNAFPISYKGGNDLNAQADEKLIEELSLTYEFFLEFQGGLAGLAKELVKSAIGAGVAELTHGLSY